MQRGYILCPFPFANLVMSLYKYGGWGEGGERREERLREKDETETERKNNFRKCRDFGTPPVHSVSANPGGSLNLMLSS